MYIDDCYPYLNIPHMDVKLSRGCRVKLGRFQSDIWEVNHGWYSTYGNRPVCGWYLQRIGSTDVKPLQLTDLDDIYLVEN